MATWWVRPDTSHSATRNGTSYATAWGGWSSIVWGGSGVAAGDTLMVCGEFASATTLSVGAHGGTDGNEVWIRGDYEPDPGRITFSSTANLTLRSHTEIRGLTITQGSGAGMFINGHTNVGVEECVFNGTANVPAINCSTASGTNTADIRIRWNTFNNVGYALRWLATTASATTATLADMIAEYNTVTNHPANTGSVGGFEVRMEVGVDASCFAQRIRFSRNAVSGPGRAFIVASGGGPPPATDKFTDITFADNEANNVGTAFMLYGSQANNHVVRNRVRGTDGLSGGLDVMSSGGVFVAWNDFADHTTTGVDGNSCIIGDLTDGAWVAFNRFRNAQGNTGAVNSGASLMLNACRNVSVYSNLLAGSRYGLWVNDNSSYSGIESLSVTNNTIAAREVAVYLRRISGSPADMGELSMQNNLLIGEQSGAVSMLNDWPDSPDEDYTWRWMLDAPTGHTFGANGSTDDPEITDGFAPLPSSPLLTQGADLGHLRDIRGHLSRKHVGAFASARLVRQ